jgi:ABC-type bacteriocin/lantibiotic exporter with double-glycine peptidase domain
MALIKLNVPTLAQELSDCCWHTSAMMIWQYWQQQTGRQGPMNTVQPVYQANTGITPPGFITLAKTVGLIPLPNLTTYSDKSLFDRLRAAGPIWCAGHWFGPGHIIVLTGVDGGKVFFNDPDGGVKKSATLNWFNNKLDGSLIGSMMCKDPKRY